MPELVGKIEPWDAAAVAQEWLESPWVLERVRGDLLAAAAAYARRGRGADRETAGEENSTGRGTYWDTYRDASVEQRGEENDPSRQLSGKERAAPSEHWVGDRGRGRGLEIPSEPSGRTRRASERFEESASLEEPSGRDRILSGGTNDPHEAYGALEEGLESQVRKDMPAELIAEQAVRLLLQT